MSVSQVNIVLVLLIFLNLLHAPLPHYLLHIRRPLLEQYLGWWLSIKE